MSFDKLPDELIENIFIRHNRSILKLNLLNKHWNHREIVTLAARFIQHKFRVARWPSSNLPGTRVLIYGKYVRYYGTLLKKTEKKIFATNIPIPGWIDIIHDPLVVRNSLKIKFVAPWNDHVYIQRILALYERYETYFSTFTS